ncbi:uncharacterized protein LOC120825619 isoform X2 [Gasterosteus aculeatus]
MIRATLTKLLILVILAVIICLPEFFTLDRVPKVNFLCVPYRPCERGARRLENGAKWKSGDAEVRRKDCEPASSNTWERDCTQEDPEPDPGRGGEDPERNWFLCEADTDMAELRRNTSPSAVETYAEVSVELRLRAAETLNLTFYEGTDRGSLHLHPPGEEEEEEDEEGRDERGPWTAFYCCLPLPPAAAESANPRRCLLRLANRTAATATVQEKPAWKVTQRVHSGFISFPSALLLLTATGGEWSWVFWLALLCVVILTIVTIVLGQIYWRRRSCRHAPGDLSPLAYTVNGQQVNDAGRHMEIIAPKGMIFHSYGSRPRAGLSPIEEVASQDDIETLLDGNDDHCYTANLHHRAHPFASPMEEQTC